LTKRIRTVLVSLLVASVLCLGSFGCHKSGPSSATAPATPIDPVTGLLDAFKTHSVVALDEGDHGNDRGHAFRLSLLRDSRFSAVVNDIVVEFGSARHQALLDRFVSGEDVPAEALRRVWQDTTQPHDIWDGPIYGEFFEAVRQANSSLAADRRLRVWLGDPPIEWENVHSRADHAKWFEQRDTYPAALIQREVLARNRRALVIYGSMHLVRHVIGINYSVSNESWAQPLVTLLEKGPDQRKVFTVWTNTFTEMEKIQPDIRQWPQPSLARLAGTVLGAADFADYYPFQTERGEIRNGQYVPISPAEWRKLPMEQQFDAVLYVGSPSTLVKSRVTAALCADAAYRDMRRERMRRSEMPPDMDGLTPHCTSALASGR
jgi:hypothetical protein